MQIFVDGYCKNAKNFFDYPYLIFLHSPIKIKQFFCYAALQLFTKSDSCIVTVKKAFFQPK